MVRTNECFISANFETCIKKLHFIMVIKKAQCFYKLDDTEQKNVFKYSLSGEAGSIG